MFDSLVALAVGVATALEYIGIIDVVPGFGAINEVSWENGM